MTAVREQIFALIEERLNEIDSSYEVERMPSGDPVSYPALHIIDAGQKPGISDVGDSRYDLAVTIHGFISQSGGSAAHTSLNDLYARTIAALLTEPPLGGLVETIDEGPMQIELATRSSVSRLVFIVDLFLTFPTRRGDPATPA